MSRCADAKHERKGHVVRLTAAAPSSASYDDKCPDHPGFALDHMCITDTQLVCSKCARASHSIGHDVRPLRSLADSLCGELEDSVAQCAGALSSLLRCCVWCGVVW